MKVLLNPNVIESYGDAMNAYFEETSKQENVEQTFTDLLWNSFNWVPCLKLHYRERLVTLIRALKWQQGLQTHTWETLQPVTSLMKTSAQW